MKSRSKRHKKLALAVSWIVMAILVATMPVEAVNYTINKIYSSPNIIEPINGINYRHRTINNAGQIAWIEICEGGLAVYLREPNGNIKQISNMMTNSPNYIRLSINDRGQVVWTTQQDGYPSGIYLSDPNSRTIPITITQSTQSVYYEYYINKTGQVAWKTWDDNGPIYLYDNCSSVLVPNSSIACNWDFNNKGEIVWQGKDNEGIEGIYLYKNGASSRIINDWRYTPVINDASQIVLNAANAFYLYDPNSLNGLKTIYIDNEVYWPSNICLNNNGQLAWQFSRPGESVWNTYLYDLSAIQNNLQIISQGLPTLFVMNDIGQIIWIDCNTYGLYLTNPGSTNNPHKIAEGGPFCINDIGQIIYLGIGGIYLATPQVEVAFKLLFPIEGYNAFTVPVSAVMDHSNPGNFYGSGEDGKVLAFNGELGDRNPHYDGSLVGYQNSNGTAFLKGVINYQNYLNCLWYDGHFGYDFAVRSKPVLAPADGKLYIPQSDPVDGNNGAGSPWNGWHTFYIDHGNGYSTWYLHCESLEPEKIAPVVLPGGTPKYDAFADVKKGQRVATSGAFGAGGAYHLHFELRKDGFASANVTDAYKEDLWKKMDIGSAINLILTD